MSLPYQLFKSIKLISQIYIIMLLALFQRISIFLHFLLFLQEFSKYCFFTLIGWMHVCSPITNCFFIFLVYIFYTTFLSQCFNNTIHLAGIFRNFIRLQTLHLYSTDLAQSFTITYLYNLYHFNFTYKTLSGKYRCTSFLYATPNIFPAFPMAEFF